MKYRIDDKEYEVIVTKKRIKNTYIRVKDDLKIYVSTHYLVPNYEIKKLLDRNKDYIIKCVNKMNVANEKQQQFYYLGEKYDIIILETENIKVIENRIYTKSYSYLEKWLNKKRKEIFLNRYNEVYNMFEENIRCPRLRIRKMTTRWGVCNKKSDTITINSELIKYSLDKLDYVIIHEFAHLVYFDHSKDFWNLVSKYCPNYKNIRKELRG